MKELLSIFWSGMVLGAGAATTAQSELMPFREKYSARTRRSRMAPSRPRIHSTANGRLTRKVQRRIRSIENIEIKVTGDVQDYKNDIAERVQGRRATKATRTG